MSRLTTEDAVEHLARLEHRSWEIDRLLDGWRPGARDDARLHHDAIGVPFDQLDERFGRPMREYDRQQVRMAIEALRRLDAADAT